jgi:hypothetical protein
LTKSTLTLSSVQQAYREGVTRLSHLLLITRHRDYFEPTDHIYSLLEPVSDDYAGIKPDYSKGKDQAFIDVVRCCIEVEKDLTILSAAECHENSVRLPGWVLDWTRVPKKRCLPVQADGTASNFRATLDTKARVGSRSTGLTLQLRGFIIGILGPASADRPMSQTPHNRIRNTTLARGGSTRYEDFVATLPKTLRQHPQFRHDQVERGVTFGSLQVPGIATGRIASPLPADLSNLKVLAEYVTTICSLLALAAGIRSA